MLRNLVVALLVANAAFFAWSQGWFDGMVGTRSIGDREPDRLTRQVRPELVRVLPPPGAASAAGAGAAASAASAPASADALACLEAGPYSDAELAAAQSSAQAALPEATFKPVKTERAGTWLVYMGRYASREALTKKEDELKRRRLPYEEMRSPASLSPGLSLGRFNQRAAAVAALDQFAQQGIRTARVVELVPATSATLLRIEKADAALAARVTALGKGFAACAKS